MEKMFSNPYENRSNKEALEKQRDKYINQELNWLITEEGQSEIKRMDISDSNELVSAIAELVTKRLKEKSGMKEGENSDEFNIDIVREKMKANGMYEEFDVEGKTITDIKIGGVVHVHPRKVQRWSNE